MNPRSKPVLLHWLIVAGVSMVACRTPQPTSRRPIAYYAPAPRTATAAAEQVATSVVFPDPSTAEPTEGCNEAPGQLFPPSAPWNQPVAGAAVAPDSTLVVHHLEEHHRTPQRFRTDFSFVVQRARASEPLRPFTPNRDHYLPDCDVEPVPVPSGGSIEGADSYQCLHGGDCHLLVHVPEQCALYEMYKADITNTIFSGGCLVRWDTRKVFGTSGRGVDCSSADASGLPITPLLFTPSDIAAGRINHAIRLVLPNSLIRHRMYVPPATHSTTPTAGSSEAPPYGARFRLKADYETSRLPAGAAVVARALQEYGMIVVDGGEVSFTTVTDRNSPLTWADVDFGARSLESLHWTDFEMIAPSGTARLWQGMCERSATPRVGNGDQPR